MQNREEMTHSCTLHEISINRISNYCKRIIIKEKRQNASFFYAIIEELNNITRNLTLLLNETMNTKTDLPKNVITKYSEITTMLIQVYELYYKFSINEYSKIKKNLETIKRTYWSRLLRCNIKRKIFLKKTTTISNRIIYMEKYPKTQIRLINTYIRFIHKV